MEEPRIDRQQRTIAAKPGELYRAFLDPALLEKWLPPAGMSGKVHRVNPVVNGGYDMSLYYDTSEPARAGKTKPDEDRFRVIFYELKPDEQIVQRILFDVSEPGFDEPITQTWRFEASGPCTTVSVACENVPADIRPEEHAAGLQSSLENLARLVER